MARYMQKRKRSTPFKRPSKRRRVVRKRYNGSTLKSSKIGGVTNMMYSRKRFNKRKYKNQLWNASFAQAKFRSSNSTSLNVSLDDAVTTKKITLVNMLNIGAEFNSYALVTDNNGTAVASTWVPEEMLTIRGGVFEMVLANNGTSQVRGRINRIWTKANAVTSYDNESVALSVTLQQYVTDWMDNFKLYDVKDFVIEAGSSYTYRYKLPVMRVNKTDVLSYHKCPCVVYELSNMLASATEAVSVVCSNNISFACDVITP
ncbi:MAG: coat protein [Acamarivirus nebulais]|uniref:Coat protein n=1 Tax=Cressdnaviricota sp. TaxID=2748378 RepID=A0A345MUR4_9VIRU|nr:MAG: coat protein [Cressdnaviricota sp.]